MLSVELYSPPCRVAVTEKRLRGAMKGGSLKVCAWWVLVVSLFFCADAQKCPRSFNISSESVKMTHCKHLTELGATLSWTYDAVSGGINVAFRAKPAANGGWVAWGINPTSTGMVGTQALLAFRRSNGTMFVGTYNVSSKNGPPPLSPLSFPVTNLSSEYRRGTITIYGTLILPSNKTMVNQVWQVGSTVQGTQPGVHAFDAANLHSFGAIDLLRGKIPVASSPAPTPGAAMIPSPSSSASANSPSQNTSKANAHPAVSWISLTLLTLFTATASGMLVTML